MGRRSVRLQIGERLLLTHVISMDWSSRHEYLYNMLESMNVRHGYKLLNRMSASMSPADFLDGSSTGRKAPKIIALADKPRGKQTKITAFFVKQSTNGVSH